jgi:hypothetical protein
MRVHRALDAPLQVATGPEHFFFRRRFSDFGYCTATMGCSTAPNWGRRVLPTSDAVGSVLFTTLEHGRDQVRLLHVVVIYPSP